MLASRLVLDHVGTRPRLHELRTDGDACQIGDDRFFRVGRNDGKEATDLVHVRLFGSPHHLHPCCRRTNRADGPRTEPP
jgi:hypothetical protein